VETGTDSVGQFAFRRLVAREYWISVSAPGFSAISKDVSLADGQTSSIELQFTAVRAQSQSLVITAKSIEPTIDLRNSEVFSRTLFSRDDQVLKQLNAGINAGQHEGALKAARPGTDPGSHDHQRSVQPRVWRIQRPWRRPCPL
jgi:hypothetical protein